MIERVKGKFTPKVVLPDLPNKNTGFLGKCEFRWTKIIILRVSHEIFEPLLYLKNSLFMWNSNLTGYSIFYLATYSKPTNCIIESIFLEKDKGTHIVICIFCEVLTFRKNTVSHQMML